MFIATVVAAEWLTEQSLTAILANPGPIEVVEASKVFRFRIAGDPRNARRRLEALQADIFIRRADAPAPELLVADMDSTMITVECIDELADYAGVKPQVAAITERAMRGELDFAGALKERVRLLEGLEVSTLARCYEERVRIMPGARTLVRTLKARGVNALLVSGGFTYFAKRVAEEIGFEGYRANRLGFADGTLDGTVERPILGAEQKREALLGQGVDPATAIAIGDGANDVPMLKMAGFGVAYHAKPAAVEAADAAVRYGDLTTVLHALGVPREEWVTD